MNRLLAAFITLLLAAAQVHACSACYGRSDSDLAKGMNMGIYVLLVILVVVLGGITAIGFYLVRRASKMAPLTPQPASAPQPQL
jgi:ABC-type antimicrobial peptide transport system permease subunit